MKQITLMKMNIRNVQELASAVTYKWFNDHKVIFVVLYGCL